MIPLPFSGRWERSRYGPGSGEEEPADGGAVMLVAAKLGVPWLCQPQCGRSDRPCNERPNCRHGYHTTAPNHRPTLPGADLFRRITSA